jgi:tight adherence protein B
MLIVIGCFVGILGLFLVMYWAFVLRPETKADRALSRRLVPKPIVAKFVRTSFVNEVAAVSSLAALERALAQFAGRLRPLERLIERAGYSTSLGTFVLASVFAAGLGALTAMQLVGEPIAVVGAAVLLGSAPLLFFRFAAKRRVAKFEEQFPEAIDLIARALRAGHAFTTGLGMVADEVAEPARSEFRLVHDRQNYGMPLQDALKGLAERVQLLDARFFVTAVLTQRESGGNLSEVLDSLSKVIRERFKLKRQVRVLSAHGRITGSVLAGLPLALAGLMFFIAPEHIGLLFNDPLGRRMIAVAAVLQVVGFLAMRRIADIEI